MNKIDVVIMHMRAYEDGFHAPYIVGCDDLLPLKEGMVALATDIWNYFLQERGQPHRCKDPGQGPYCQQCGSHQESFKPGFLEFTDFVVEFTQMTYDEVPYDGVSVEGDYIPFTWRFDMPSEEWLPRIQADTFFNMEQYAEQLIAILAEYTNPGTFEEHDLAHARFLCAPNKGEGLKLSDWVEKYFNQELPED